MINFQNINFTLQTYCTDKMVTDSAASATAFLTGIKTSNGLLGIKDNVKRGECDQREENKLTSVLEYAHQAGQFISIVSFTVYSVSFFHCMSSPTNIHNSTKHQNYSVWEDYLHKRQLQTSTTVEVLTSV